MAEYEYMCVEYSVWLSMSICVLSTVHVEYEYMCVEYGAC